MLTTAEIAGAWLCLAAPLAGTILILVGGMRLTRRTAAWIATTSCFVAFGGAVWAFLGVHGNPTNAANPNCVTNGAHPVCGGPGQIHTIWIWLQSGSFHIGLSVLVDPLSTVMMLIVSGVGGLIVLYSIGYMDGDPEERRYFAYISFFVFSMLMLVEGGNLLLLLVGWGLVGLSSYLLIGFWHERPSAVQAAKKAFVMNAFGDATMALALFILIAHTHSLSFATSFAEAPHLGGSIDLVALGLLGGAAAKSAQIPLQTWLPDAMEGPTPVSALIHAATMVTAGVYLIARLHPLFEQAPTVELLAAGTGALTLLVAGLIALVQTDIKRVIAYSTMSQIGYMFLGAGVGAYSAGMFHLMTHAFFKALLFMTAGLAIHALSGEQDIRKMRGLGKLMPFTKWCFLAGALALVGIPPFSGFFSKDSIVASAAALGTWYGWVFWVCGVAGAFLTGLYTFRLWFLVFPGEPSAFVREHHHREGRFGEGHWTMLVPVGVLAVLATVGGWLQWAPRWHPFTNWLSSAARTLPAAVPTNTQEYYTSAATVIAGLIGIGLAWAIYSEQSVKIPALPSVERLLENKFYFDALYDRIFYGAAAELGLGLRLDLEDPVILQTGPDLADTTLATAGLVRRIQTGFLRTYVFFVAAGAAAIVLAFLIAK
ncbi:MAG TPA: NADH-quinone oxidoreductase subunit L [Gaiellaceae bacterium]|nr:NADH-quinone oxidoreductase subunit L [Gaiellaceae bacterium]